MEDDKEGSSSNVEKTITTNEEASTFKEEADKKAEKEITTQNDENISEVKKSCEIEKEEEKNNGGEVIPKPSASNDSKAELAKKIITNTKNSAEDNTTNSDEKQQQNSSSNTKSREIEKKSHEIEKELTKVIANANKLVGEGGKVEEENDSSKSILPTTNPSVDDSSTVNSKQSSPASSREVPVVQKDKKGPPKVTMAEVLASKHLSDGSKFHVFKELVQEGHITNREVVNSVLYLVS